MKQERYPLSYLAARVVEAAGQLGADEAFWAMHAWVAEQGDEFSRETALAHATAIGLDRASMEGAIDSDPVIRAIAEDIELALAHEISWAPKLYVQGRQITAWAPSRELLESILRQAAAADPANP